MSERVLTPPTIELLVIELDEVVEWERLSIHLKLNTQYRKIRADYIQYGGVDRCKLEVFRIWLQSSNADKTWQSVIDALKFMKYNTLALAIKTKYASVLQEPAIVTFGSTESTSGHDDEEASVPQVHVVAEKKVLRNFSKIQEKYTSLVQELKRSLRNRSICDPDITLYDFLRIQSPKVVHALPSSPSFDDLFSIVIENCDFMHFSLIEKIINTLFGAEELRDEKIALKKNLKQYNKHLEKFKRGNEMQALVTKIFEHKKNGVASVEMKLEPVLDELSIASFFELVKSIFFEKYKELTKLRVVKGCLSANWLVSESICDEIISTVKPMKPFMNSVGVISLRINDVLVYKKDEKELRLSDTFLAFSQAINQNIEACEFILYATSKTCDFTEQLIVHRDPRLLHIACSKGHTTVVQSLIELEFPVDVADIKNVTPLMIASEKGYLKIVKLLLNICSIDTINAQRFDGETALHLSCDKHHAHVVRHLLSHQMLDKNICNKNGMTPLMITVGSGQRKLTRRLLLAGADPNCAKKDGDTALHIASFMGNYSIAKDLLKFKANPEASKDDGWTPLMVAIPRNYLEIVKLLLEEGRVNPNKQNERDGDTPLQIACWNNCLDIVKLLLQNKADPNLAKHDGWTPLIAASLLGHFEIVEILLEWGASINAQGYDGVTPVYVASQEGHSNVLSLLIKSNADLQLSKLEDNKSTSPLMIACQNGHVEVVQLLQKANVPINTQNETGATPLMVASFHGHSTVVEQLLKFGADPFLVDKNNQNALDVTKDEACMKLLRDAGLSTAHTTKKRPSTAAGSGFMRIFASNAKNFTTRLVGNIRKQINQFTAYISSS